MAEAGADSLIEMQIGVAGERCTGRRDRIIRVIVAQSFPALLFADDCGRQGA